MAERQRANWTYESAIDIGRQRGIEVLQGELEENEKRPGHLKSSRKQSRQCVERLRCFQLKRLNRS